MATHTPRTTRRTALIIGSAVLACAVIAAPFALHAAHHDGGSRAVAAPTPRPSTTAVSSTVPLGTLRGDVDGDGRDDVVSLSRRDLLRVDLASGSTVRQVLQDEPHLEGLADVGQAGLAIAVTSGRHGRTWTVWALRGDQLVRLDTRGSLFLGDEPGFETTWVSDHTVYDGTPDPLQSGEDHVTLVTRSWRLHAGKLAPHRVALSCWDRSSVKPPSPCAPGQDWRYDVGPRGDLPALLPADHRGASDDNQVRFDSGERWRVHPLQGHADPEDGRWVLHYAGQAGPSSVDVPAGWAPALFRAPVRVGDLTDGLLLSQEGGDSDTWRVYVQWAGHLQELATTGPVRLGGGFTPDGDTAYLSWLGRDGHLYTRIGTPRPGHFHVYTWQPVGGSASTPPVLHAVDLGTVCIDDTLQTYGTCHG